MCGIAGDIIFNSAKSAPHGLTRMLDALRYRGPDETGSMHGEGWAIGARRLSIVAPDNGSQPFVGACGSLCVFNGEIYNYKELRAELQQSGIHFGTDGDGEVIVHLYEREGLDFVHRLRGMFATAIYDPRARRTVLARDRIGKKPLFYHHRPGERVVFASSLNAVASADGVSLDVDPESIDYFLSYRVIPAPLTIYRDIRKVEAGCVMTFEPAGAREIQYWTFPQYQTPVPGHDDDLARELRGLLETAVNKRIPSEVPYGTFLSGGLDSSLLAALTKQHSRERVRTFSIGFAQAAFDERPFAREVARTLGTEHTEYEITPSDALAAVGDLTWHFGEPFAFPSSIACYHMSRLAREHATVVLGGDGADELFAGYGRYKRLMQTTGRDRAELNGQASAVDTIARDYEPILIDGIRTEWKLNLLKPSFTRHLPQPYPRNRLAGRVRPAPNVEFLNRVLALDCGFWLTDAQMCKVDVSSMAHSLEVRHPILDESVVEFAARLPAGLKLRNHEEKYLLRRAAEPFLPEHILRRPKQELAVPLEDWLTGNLREEVTRTLTAPACLERGYFEPGALRSFVDGYDSSRAYAIWTLYILERWHLDMHDVKFS